MAGGCDPGELDDAPCEDEGRDEGDTGADPNLDQGRFPEGPSLADHAVCESVVGTTIGACSGNSELLRDCDDNFMRWCQDHDGDVEFCGDSDVRLLLAPTRCGEGPGLRPCDLDFEYACDTIDGAFVCDNPVTCLSAGCLPPPNHLGITATTTCWNGEELSCSCPAHEDGDTCSCEEIKGESVACVGPNTLCQNWCPPNPDVSP